MKLYEKSLMDISKLSQNTNFCFNSIIEYINLIKDYPTNGVPYRCEWLDPIIMDELIICNKLHTENITPNKQISNITTFNYLKVQKVI
jgi:hypothetical protein